MKRSLQYLHNILCAAYTTLSTVIAAIARAIVRAIASFIVFIVSLWKRLDPDIHDLHIYGGAVGVFYGIKHGLVEFIVVFGFFLIWGAYGAIWSVKRGE